MLLDLRFARAWLAAGWVLVLCVVITSLVPAPSLPQVNVSDKFEHTLAYAVLTLWFTGIYRRTRYLHIAIALFCLGVAIEFAQGAMNLGRQRDFHDVIANTGGIVLGMIITFIGIGGWARRAESWARQ